MSLSDYFGAYSGPGATPSSKRVRYTFTPKGNRYGDQGKYVGPFARPRPRRPPSKFDKAGYSAVVERYGSQSQAQCSYVGFMSFCHTDLGKVLGISFIRKLMKRHYGYEYTHPDQQIVNTSQILDPAATLYTEKGPVSIQFYYEEVTAADLEPAIALGHTISLTGGLTLSQFASNFFTNVLTSTTFGANQASVNFPYRRIHGYRFGEYDYTAPGADGSNYPFTKYTTMFPLRNQYMTAKVSTKVTLQNATVSDDGSKSTDVIDTNPIRGKLYSFADIFPKLQQRRGAFGSTSADNAFKLQVDPNGDGIIKPSAALLGDWQNVPTPVMFDNCTGVANVMLQPGNMKTSYLKFYFNGTLEKFMKGFAALNTPLQKGAFGTCQVFAFEKILPTGASTNVTVNFNYRAWSACVFGKRLGALMQRGGASDSLVVNA